MENSIESLKRAIAKCPTSKGGRRQYSEKVKAKILNYLDSQEISVWNLAKELGLNGSLVKRWDSEREESAFKELKVGVFRH